MDFYRSVFVVVLFTILTGCNDSDQERKQAENGPNSNDFVPTFPFTDGRSNLNTGDKSGKIEIHFVADYKDATGKIVIYESECKFRHPVDSVDLVDGKCSFDAFNCSRGVYWASMGNKDNICPFILNPDESVVTFHIRSKEMDGSLYSTDSKENMGFSKYYVQKKVWDQKINDKRKARSKSNKKEQYDKLIAGDEMELNKVRASIIGEFPGTYLAKLLTWEQEPERQDRNHYWDNVNFDDYSLIRSRVMHDREQSFFRMFYKGSEQDYMAGIDLIVEKAKGNPQVLEAILYSLLEGFSQTKFDGVCAYILDHYIYGDGCGAEISQVLQNRSQGIRNVQIGSVPPNIKLPLLNGGTSDLHQLAEKNKYTLIMFWSSWCKHCSDESEMVLSVYQKYKPKGFEILGVSVDNNADMWKTAVKNRGFTFGNVCGMKEWESQVAKDYFVVKTPVMIVLDSNKKVVFKTTTGIGEVDQFLKSKLGQ